jgi:uncharacterized membrane protein YccF (DUF307 family)
MRPFLAAAIANAAAGTRLAFLRPVVRGAQQAGWAQASLFALLAFGFEVLHQYLAVPSLARFSGAGLATLLAAFALSLAACAALALLQGDPRSMPGFIALAMAGVTVALAAVSLAEIALAPLAAMLTSDPGRGWRVVCTSWSVLVLFQATRVFYGVGPARAAMLMAVFALIAGAPLSLVPDQFVWHARGNLTSG